jgi:L-arabinokinase
MRRIALYLSGHGLGHAMRMKELLSRIRERAPSAVLYVTGPTPRWVFEEPPAVPVRLRPLRCDVGAIQNDSLHLDVRRTIEENETFYRGVDALVRREAAFLRAEGIDLVVGDIPPLAFLAASEARLPSVAVGNFSWDWIYEEYAAERASFRSIVELVRGAYGRADLLLRLPMHGAMGAFRRIRDIPLIARKAATPRGEVRRRLGIADAERRKVVFISMGGHAGAEIRESGRTDFGGHLYLSYFRPAARIPNLILIADRAGIAHPDIVAASDCVISKPGYCTVAECIANNTPLVYTSRDHFREYAVMAEGAARYCRARLLPREDFHAGAWAGQLEALFAAPPRRPEALRTDGAEEAAGIILETAGDAAWVL